MQLGVIVIIIFVVLGIVFFIVFGTSYFKTEDSQNENLQNRSKNRSTVIFPDPASIPPECKYNPNDLLCQFQLEKQRMKLSQNE